MEFFKAFFRDEEGTNVTEYAMVLALIAIVCYLAIQFVGTELNIFWEGLGGEIATWDAFN